MALYLVSYDIAEKNDDYQSLWDYLEELGAVRILYSEWATPFTGSAVELVKKLAEHVKKGDRLLACELFNSPSVAWLNLKISVDEFKKLLRDHARGLN